MEFDLDSGGASAAGHGARPRRHGEHFPGLDEVKLGPFLIDRYEITNRQFKQFVASGGYRKPDYWKQDFVKDGRTLSREEAVRCLSIPPAGPALPPGSWVNTRPDTTTIR